MLLVMNNVIVKIMGGFGNQLFCYALGYSVARENESRFIIDVSQQEADTYRKLDLLNLNVEYDDKISIKKSDRLIGKILFKMKHAIALGIKTQYVKEKRAYVFDKSILTKKKESIYLEGYWQSYKYFEKYRKDLIRLFIFSGEMSEYYRETIKKIRSCSKSVAIHIRRGDYIAIGCNVNIKFYENAIQKMINNLGKDLEFFLFSDDIDFAKEFSSRYDNMNVINNPNKENSTIEDFMLMKECMHQIISNSSFSWWAAWLNTNEEKIVICPEIDEWTGDFYPEKWIKIKSNYA